MKKTIFILASLLSAAAMQSQTITFEGDGTKASYNLNDVDETTMNGSTHSLRLSYPIEEMKEITFSPETIDLGKADSKMSDNEIKSFVFKAVNNEDVVLYDAKGEINGDEIKVFIPYLENKTMLKASFETNGKVFVSDKRQKSGVSANDFSDAVEYKVADGKGNLRTYKVNVYNSGLPIVRVFTESEIASKVWSESVSLSVTSADGKVLAETTTQVKAKGGQNSAAKRDFNLKLAKKTEMCGMTKNKRWVLLANAEDGSLMRNKLGLTLGKELSGLAWTPSSEFVELIVGNKHLGTYLLCEQIRVSDGRVSEDAVWKIDTEAEIDDDYFVSENGTKCILEDAVDDYSASNIANAKKTIDAFEKALDGSSIDYAKYIDAESFVDWIWANQICKNENSNKKNVYFRITKDGKIALSPIYTNEKWLGNNEQSAEGNVAIGNAWIEKLMQKSTDFSALVCNRFSEIESTESVLLNTIKDYDAELELSAKVNSELWKNNQNSSKEDSPAEWIKARYKWLSASNNNLCKCAKKDNATSQNEIKTFAVKKSANSSAVFSDYTATISGNSIDVFVPYLVEFDLTAEFTTASNCTIYCDGEEVKSGQTKINYLKERQFKVVASNGDVRTYNVSIHNSGLPVLFINTKNGAGINDKTTWLTQTEFKCYNADGTLEYSAKDSEVKGRGNSTWTASQDKKPYAVRLSEKERLFGMAEHKRWVLMANWYDATFFRNAFSNWLGKKYTNQQWVPSGYNVELVLNGAHKGNYYFCEQAKIHENRVDGEFLIEADIKAKGTGGMGGFGGFPGFGGGWGGGGNTTPADDGSIDGPKSNNAFYPKHPDVASNSSDFQRIKSIIEKFENALYSGNYSEVEKLVDLESFVDWYMIKEWSHDVDGNMHTSCYFTIMEDGTIKMGPMWDFDIAWGGNPLDKRYNETEGYYITTNPISQSSKGTTTSWFGEFIKMPAFLSILKTKVSNLNDNLDEILAYIDENTEKLVLSATVSQSRNSGGGGGFGWGFGGGGGGGSTVTADDYRKSMNDLKTFVKTRMAWFNNEMKKK